MNQGKIDVKTESKKLIKEIKANMKKRDEETIELLEAGSVANKMEKFGNKLKKRVKDAKE